ncbi:hypothetical protein AZI86_13125 [Bdellovibrio bacteriovorus]|uniref:AraC effector-binding domain-containing protein n=1 Tax=Bdellovibrio bacteriovorus TaxID=959 RepID=A0A150WJQ6_BDEBC|nr:GyrI-like domain-containing protein [Bdellovibrio bacteriovorus]KYG63761.1 hypothetical protein AZI86_13125 [Bdellovibrio bacteriovorus]
MKYDFIDKTEPTKCVGYSIHIKMPEEREKIFALWERFNQNKDKIENSLGTSYGISEFNGEDVKYSAMMEVSDFGEKPEDMTTMVLTPRSYAQFVHDGTVQEIGSTCNLIFDEVPKAGLKPGGPLIEVYSKNFKGLGREEVPILLTLSNENKPAASDSLKHN